MNEVVVVRWALGWSADRLTRTTVAEVTGRDPGVVHHSCPVCGSVVHGRPYVEAPVEVSRAYADGLVVVAVSTAGRVGVDVELERDLQRPDPPGRAWLRTEAVTKAVGGGLALGTVTFDGDRATVGATRAWVVDLTVPTGYAGALAGLSAERPAVQAGPGRGARPATGC